MTFDPSKAFVTCPKCAADERHVHHVSREAWACNACGSGFEVRLHLPEAGNRRPVLAACLGKSTAVPQFITYEE